MSRIPLPSVDSMSAAQKQVYEQIIAGPRGRLIGPLRAALHKPELAQRWQSFGAILRYDTCFPKLLNELAIILTARRWNSQVEWFVHAQAALDAGLPSEIIEAIKNGLPPTFSCQQQYLVYEYVRQLQQTGNVENVIYDAVLQHWDVVGVVELTALVGYYTMVSMTLNAHYIPVPDEQPDPLIVPIQNGNPALSELPCATLSSR